MKAKKQKIESIIRRENQASLPEIEHYTVQGSSFNFSNLFG